MWSAVWGTRSTSIWVSKDQTLRVELRTVSTFKKEELVNWSRNRPADELRVTDIYSYLVLNDVELLPGVIYVWQNPLDDHLSVYDGIHRLEAARRLPYDVKALFHIRITTREQEIIDDFIQLNKAISVPSVYTEENSTRKRKVCELVVSELCRRYPQFLSTSRRPFPYNFNRDVFMDHMAAWDIDFREDHLVERILQELWTLNEEARTFVQEKGIATPRKCVHADFYLFYLSPSRIASHMTRRL